MQIMASSFGYAHKVKRERERKKKEFHRRWLNKSAHTKGSYHDSERPVTDWLHWHGSHLTVEK